MASIESYITQIMSAVYGEDVRGSIRDALRAMNNENGAILLKSFDGFFPTLNKLSRYFVCSTAASETTKTIYALSGGYNFESPDGMIVLVKFEHGNTAVTDELRLTLVGGAQASVSAPIRYHRGLLPDAGSIKENGIYVFIYTTVDEMDYDTSELVANHYWELVGNLAEAFDTVKVTNPSGHTTLIPSSMFGGELHLHSGDEIEVESKGAVNNVYIGTKNISDDLSSLFYESNYTIYSGYCLTYSGDTVSLTPKTGYSVVLVKNCSRYSAPKFVSMVLDYEGAGDDPSEFASQNGVCAAIISETSSLDTESSYSYSEKVVVTDRSRSGGLSLADFDDSSSLVFTLSPSMTYLDAVEDGTVEYSPISYLRKKINESPAIDEDTIDRKDFTPADLGFEIFDDYGIRRQYVTSTSGGSYYRVKLEAKTGFMTILIKNVQDYDISEYDFTLDYGTGDDGNLMNKLLTVAGITSNSFSSTALFAGNHYKVASNGTKKYSEINLNSDPSTQPKALLVSFYKDGASASEVLINGTIKINFKKYVVKKFKELQQQIRLLASDPTVDETVEGGSENG